MWSVPRIEIAARVEAPIDELFDLMADPATEEDWNPDALEVRRLDGGPIGPGARWLGRYKGMGSMDITLEVYERPSLLAFAITGSRLDMDWRFQFVPAATASQLTASADLRPKGFMRLLSPLLGIAMRRTFSKRPAQLAAGVAARRPPESVRD